jgi:hypothetical protein
LGGGATGSSRCRCGCGSRRSTRGGTGRCGCCSCCCLAAALADAGAVAAAVSVCTPGTPGLSAPPSRDSSSRQQQTQSMAEAVALLLPEHHRRHHSKPAPVPVPPVLQCSPPQAASPNNQRLRDKGWCIARRTEWARRQHLETRDPLLAGLYADVHLRGSPAQRPFTAHMYRSHQPPAPIGVSWLALGSHMKLRSPPLRTRWEGVSWRQNTRAPVHALHAPRITWVVTRIGPF